MFFKLWDSLTQKKSRKNEKQKGKKLAFHHDHCAKYLIHLKPFFPLIVLFRVQNNT